MSYQVIARKYRPQKFADVVGQEHVTQTLANAIARKRIAHAYLFCGPRGTGKTTIARIFAKCLNCQGGPKVDYEDSDPRVQEITEGRSMDVLEIDGASNNGVEQVRELRDTCQYAPAHSPFKIYIIDEVHMLSAAAFNALLKTLEEPPAHVKFMFATTDPEKVLPTILSRCQRFDLRRIPGSLIVKHLAEIALKEKVSIEPAALEAIARGADGGMRDAESTLDQLISFCGDTINEVDVLSMFGLAASNQILSLARAVVTGATADALKQLDNLTRGGKDLGRLLGDLLGYFRNLMVFQASGGDANLIEDSEDALSALKQDASQVPPAAVPRILEVFSEAEMRLREATSRKILVEITLLRAIEARTAVPIDLVLKELNQLRTGDAPAPSKPAKLSVPEPVPASVNPVPQPALRRPEPAPQQADSPPQPARTPAAPIQPVPIQPDGSVPDIKELWLKLIDAVGRSSPFLRSYLTDAHPVSFQNGSMVIGFDPEFEDRLGLVDNPRNHNVLITKLSELGFPRSTLKFIKAETPIGWQRPAAASIPATPAPKPAQIASPSPNTKNVGASNPAPAPASDAKTKIVPISKDEFKNDPLIQKALDIFKGTIVEVRS